MIISLLIAWSGCHGCVVSYSMGVNRPRAGLASALVVGAVDPGDDGDAELVAGGPGAPVEHVALQEREERFHRRVVAGGADLAHRADEAGPPAGQRPEFAVLLT